MAGDGGDDLAAWLASDAVGMSPQLAEETVPVLHACGYYTVSDAREIDAGTLEDEDFKSLKHRARKLLASALSSGSAGSVQSPLPSPAAGPSSSVAQRLSNISREDGRDRSPLAPLFEGLAVPQTLVAACEPLFDAGVAPSNLKRFIDYVRVAVQQRAVLHEAPYDVIPLAMKEALMLYTLHDHADVAQSPFYKLNESLRTRHDVQLWKHLIALLLHGLKHLPGERVDTVFRGCDKIPSELPREMVEPGNEFTFCQFGSTAKTLKTAGSFVGSAGTLWSLSLRNDAGRDISVFSLFPGETEVLLPPNCRFRVRDSGKVGSATVVDCIQVATLDPLLVLGSPEGANNETSGPNQSDEPVGTIDAEMPIGTIGAEMPIGMIDAELPIGTIDVALGAGERPIESAPNSAHADAQDGAAEIRNLAAPVDEDGNPFPCVIDMGSDTIQAGFGGDLRPKVEFRSVVSRGLAKSYVGDDVLTRSDIVGMSFPIQHGKVTNWDQMEEVWHHTFRELRAAPEEQALLLTEAPCNPDRNREKTTQIMFETFNVPAMFLSPQTELALYASGRTAGFVVDVGHGHTNVAAVYEGYRQGAPEWFLPRCAPAGADLSDYLLKILHEGGFEYMEYSQKERDFIIRDIKENFCHTALDFDQELQRSDYGEQVYTLPDGKTFTLGNERFRCPELLFQPDIHGIERTGLAEVVHSAIQNQDLDERKDYYGNVVLVGGSSRFPAIADRMQKELTALAPSTMSEYIKIIAPPERKYSVWIGGSIVASLSTLSWISKEQYDESGPSIARRMHHSSFLS
jgi:actin-related protein